MATNPILRPELSIDIETQENAIIAQCTGRVVSDTADILKSTIKPLFEQHKAVVLDFTNVRYMDSSGLGAVVGLYVSAKASHCQLKLVNLNQRLKELFSLTRLGEIMTEGHDPNYLGMP